MAYCWAVSKVILPVLTKLAKETSKGIIPTSADVWIILSIKWVFPSRITVLTAEVAIKISTAGYLPPPMAGTNLWAITPAIVDAH